MTPRQQVILNYIRQRQAEAVPPPTLREICEECNVSSTSVVAYNLEALQRQGHIIWRRETARGIMLRDTPGETIDELRRELAADKLKIARLYKLLAMAEAKILELQERV